MFAEKKLPELCGDITGNFKKSHMKNEILNEENYISVRNINTGVFLTERSGVSSPQK